MSLRELVSGRRAITSLPALSVARRGVSSVQLGDRKKSVHRAGSKALEVECDVAEAERAQIAADAIKELERKRTRKLSPSELDACELSVVSHAELGEAECVQCGLGSLHLRERLGSDRAAVLDARAEAGGGG